MKKVSTSLTVLLLFTLLFATGCQKQIEPLNEEAMQLNEESADQAAARGGDNSRGCRLTMYDYYDGLGDFHSYDLFIYKKGLVDKWTASYGWVFKMKYDRNEKLKSSEVYEGDILLYKIDFVYRNNKVVKEIWYQGNTNVVDDKVIITYNRKGQMIKNESQAYDFYVLYTYEANGQLKSWHYFSGGMPNVKSEYTSNERYKNPFRSTPGVDYAFPYVNSGIFSSAWWYSSERVILYDENGIASIYYDLDPCQTQWQVNRQNYPLFVDYTDQQSGAHVTNGFDYENCGGEHGGDHHKSNEMNNSKAPVPAGKSISLRSILSGPKGEIKERLSELRKEMKNKLQQ